MKYGQNIIFPDGILLNQTEIWHHMASTQYGLVNNINITVHTFFQLALVHDTTTPHLNLKKVQQLII